MYTVIAQPIVLCCSLYCLRPDAFTRISAAAAAAAAAVVAAAAAAAAASVFMSGHYQSYHEGAILGKGTSTATF
jgi:hypothetical protein